MARCYVVDFWWPRSYSVLSVFYFASRVTFFYLDDYDQKIDTCFIESDSDGRFRLLQSLINSDWRQTIQIVRHIISCLALPNDSDENN